MSSKTRWGIKEVVTTVLFSVLIIIIQFTASSLAMVNTDLGLVAGSAVACFLAGPVFVLMTLCVRKFGTSIFLAVLTSLVFCLAGNYWFMVPFYLALGIIVDLVIVKPAWRANPNRVIAAWTVYSGLYVGSSLVPVFVNLEAYVAEATNDVRQLDQSYIDSFLGYFTHPEWVALIVVITMVGGFLGALLGKKLAKKHFVKSGAL